MIKTSGYRVSPTEIEEAAYDTGLVRDVVALGLDDDKLGQHVVLVVAPLGDYTEEALIGRLRQSLPRYMVPSRVITREELPRSPNGKFDRALLRQEFNT
jgi:acyl-CoA synthetase (AMP-forming)/AMP-acid ligase II